MRALLLVCMCAGHFLYMYRLRLPRGIGRGERQPQRGAPPSVARLGAAPEWPMRRAARPFARAVWWTWSGVIAVALAMAAEMRAPMCGRRVGAALRADSGCVLYRMCGAVCDVHEKEHQLPAV